MVQSVLLSGVTVVGAITPAPVHPRKHGLPGCGSVGLPRVFLFLRSYSSQSSPLHEIEWQFPAVTTLLLLLPCVVCPLLLLPAPTLLMPCGGLGHTG